MRTREIMILGLFIIAVCVVSLIPFSNSYSEGLETTNPISTSVNLNGNTVATSSGNTITGNATTAPAATTTPSSNLVINNFPISITTNVDFINAVIYVMAQPQQPQNDKISVYNIQGLISHFNTQNSATLLGEMSNPNNLTDSRLFLQYMNWFASHCPLDSNTCTGLC